MEHRQILPSGSVLDNSYRIDRMIGAGGFGITYLAEDTGLSSPVCIKEYYPAQFGVRDEALTVRARSQSDLSLFDRCRTSFLAEARNLAKFDHPSIVRVIRVFEAYGTAYMVMKFEEGQSFDQWLRKLGHPPSEPELLKIMLPTIDALERLHNANLIHRDIAPDNILIRPDGSPVLLDFGSARRTQAELSQTMTGIVKAGYSPTEQYSTEAKHQGPWTDIYALGGTMYRAITGAPPPESTQRLIEDAMTPLVELAPATYSAPTLAAIDACLRLQPKHRPQSIAILRQLLTEYGGATQLVPGFGSTGFDRSASAVGAFGQQSPSQPSSLPSQRTSQPRSTPPAVSRPPYVPASTPAEVRGGAPVWVPIAGGLAALVLLLGGFYAFLSGTSAPTPTPPTRPIIDGSTTPSGVPPPVTPRTGTARTFTTVDGVQIGSTSFLRRLNNSTLNLCRQACQDEAQCSAADFSSRNARCDLYTGRQTNFVRELGYTSILSSPEEADLARAAARSTTTTTTPITTPPATGRQLTEVPRVGITGNRATSSTNLSTGITAEACQKACVDDAECTAATYSAPLQLCELYSSVTDVSVTATKRAFFKLDADVVRARNVGTLSPTPPKDGSTTPPLTAGTRPTAAVQTIINTGLEGDQIRTIPEQTADQCRQLCEGETRCIAADHSTSRRWCALYSRVTNQLNAPGITAFRVSR